MISSLLRDISAYTKSQILTHCRGVLASGFYDEDDLVQDCARKVIEAFPKLKNQEDKEAVRKQVKLVVHNHLLDMRRKAGRDASRRDTSEFLRDDEEILDTWDYASCNLHSFATPEERLRHRHFVAELLEWAYQKDIRYFDILQTFIFMPLDNEDFYTSYQVPETDRKLIFNLMDWAIQESPKAAIHIGNYYGVQLLTLQQSKISYVHTCISLTEYMKELTPVEIRDFLRAAYKKNEAFLPYLKEVFYSQEMRDVVEEKRQPGKGITLTQICEFLGYNRYLITRLKKELQGAIFAL